MRSVGAQVQGKESKDILVVEHCSEEAYRLKFIGSRAQGMLDSKKRKS